MLLQKAPYFRSIVLGLVVREAPGLGTIGVTDNGFLLVDYAFIAKLGGGDKAVAVQEMAGLWAHETLHRLNRHGARRGTRNPRTWNTANDMAINTTVREMGLRLPPDGKWPADFGFAEGLPAETYYELLQQMAAQQQAGQQSGKGQPQQQGQPQSGKGPKKKGQNGGQQQQGQDPGGQDDSQEGSGQGDSQDPGDQDGQGGGGQGQGEHEHGDRPNSGGGWCGSCAGRPVPNEPDAGDPDARTDAEMERGVREVASAIRDFAAKNRGKLPGELARWADTALEPPKVPWRQKLGTVCRRAVAWSLGAIQHRYDAPSRRQAGIGYGGGRPVLPRLRRPVPRVVVAVDTSGSMSTNELSVAMSEVDGVLKAVGAEVDFISIDADIHSELKVHDVKSAIAALKGGGGTDFRPLFERIEQMRPRPDVCVFATDGYGPAPAVPPAGLQVVWLLIGKNPNVPASWGESIVIEDL